jgi:hypothetical protein
MTRLQKGLFVIGAAIAISLGSTVFVLILDRVFPGYRLVTIVGPFLCAASALIFSKCYYKRL